MSEPDGPVAAAAAIADGRPVDWTAATTSARTPAERVLLEQLRLIASAATQPTTLADDKALPGEKPGVLYRAVLIVAWVKTILSTAVAIVGIVTNQPHAVTLWPPLINQSVFGATALVLSLGGTRDLRVRRLGDWLLLVASAFSDRVLLTMAPLLIAASGIDILRHTSTDAFLAFGLWMFVCTFPAPAHHRADRVVTGRALRAAWSVAVLLFVANAMPLVGRVVPLPSRLMAIAAVFDRHAPARSLYWPLLFIITAAALPYLVWKSRREPADERRRVGTFVVAFVASLTPMLLTVIVSPFVPFFDDPARRDLVGVFLYISLLSIVPTTAYAVAVDRVMDLQVIVTAAMRHAAVRFAVCAACFAPLGLLAVYIYGRRHSTVIEILSPSSIAILPLLLLGVLALMALTFRPQLLAALDRRVLSNPANVPEVLAALERSVREVNGVRAVIAILTREIDRALYPRDVVILVVAADERQLSSPTAAVAPLSLDSTLAALIGLTREEVDVGVDAAGPVRRLLPEHDRRWLETHGFQLLAPLTASTGVLLGIIALGEKRSGLPYSKDDRLLLSAMATHGAMAIENRSLRDMPFRYLTDPHDRIWQGIDWSQEPAALCPRCQLVRPSHTATCDCGAAMTSAALPLLINGKFRLERLIGWGGMSVVYIATDTALNRKVALKTMPQMQQPERAARLYREARAMASVLHPNLAMIFGIERWRGAPLLIVEYIDGGTLADRLRREGAVPLREALGLGVVLADVLDRVHGSGVLHRDIKPSNIGYTGDGVPKLMDFGVAWMPHGLEAPLDPHGTVRALLAGGGSTAALPSLTSADHIIGTPLYLAPEAVDGADADIAFDLWSLNLTLYESIAGRNPFSGETVFDVFERVRRAEVPDIRCFAPDCPAAVAQFFTRALALDATHRPSSSAELRNRLRELIALL
jgi:hypothetical protein